MHIIDQLQFQTRSGIKLRRSAASVNYETAIENLVNKLDDHKGVLLASSFEYPGRYTRWDVGFVNPPLQLVAKNKQLNIFALNPRGEILLPEVFRALQDHADIDSLSNSQRAIEIVVKQGDENFNEEMRSRRPSVFTVLRSLVDAFYAGEEQYLGFYGAFGYDLTFQFEDVERFQHREEDDRDLVLYLPDQILVADHRAEQATMFSYEFNCRGWTSNRFSETTGGFRRTGSVEAYVPAESVEQSCDHKRGEYAAQVTEALNYFREGELFEVVPGQMFFEPCQDSPAQVFKRLRANNPAPYGALINLGEQEYLVAASPEMFVRVEATTLTKDGETEARMQIETCPISGTIKRGEDAIGDARQIQTLLNSEKDESELSMCTDVDRNDKARVCEPGSVKVVGRRQIEMYSRLIHTVDHVKGVLKREFDALDGFLAHTWAVTVTGAPKLAAMQFIEKNEKSPRHWYGGAMGFIGFNGSLNTGLTLRTVRVKNGVAEVRAGATLLIDSDPEAEEAETRLKASALIDAIRGDRVKKPGSDSVFAPGLVGDGMNILMVDHQDSFVHNLAAYFRQFGASLTTMRPGMARETLTNHSEDFDLVSLSPGPSSPQTFDMKATIEVCLENDLPIFGVCLGLQGLVEYFGGELEQLGYPMHGKPSIIKHDGDGLFAGISEEFTAGRYHSLVAKTVPDCLHVCARTEDDKVMAISHKTKPISALQFHPESIMSLEGQAGHRMIANVLSALNTKAN